MKRILLLGLLALLLTGCGKKSDVSEETVSQSWNTQGYYLYQTKDELKYLDYLDKLDKEECNIVDISIAVSEVDSFQRMWYFITYQQ